jgi:hypothetical protein
MPAQCHVCEGRESIDSLLWLQLGSAPVAPIPLCRIHHAMAEGALAEVRKIQSPPVNVYCSAVTAGGGSGRAG